MSRTAKTGRSPSWARNVPASSSRRPTSSSPLGGERRSSLTARSARAPAPTTTTRRAALEAARPAISSRFPRHDRALSRAQRELDPSLWLAPRWREGQDQEPTHLSSAAPEVRSAQPASDRRRAHAGPDDPPGGGRSDGTRTLDLRRHRSALLPAPTAQGQPKWRPVGPARLSMHGRPTWRAAVHGDVMATMATLSVRSGCAAAVRSRANRAQPCGLGEPERTSANGHAESTSWGSLVRAQYRPPGKPWKRGFFLAAEGSLASREMSARCQHSAARILSPRSPCRPPETSRLEGVRSVALASAP
jgi:hypothetical protein